MIEVEKDGNRVCGTSIMGLMMLGAAMGDTIVIHVEGDGADEALDQAGGAGRGALRRRIMPRQVTAFSNPTVKLLRSLRDKKARRSRRPVPRRGAADPRPRRATAAGCPRSSPSRAEGAKHPLAAEIIAATEAAGGDAIETTPDILSKMSGKDNPQMLLGAYRQPDTVARRGSTGRRRRCGSSPRRCAIPAISARSCRTGDAVGAGGLILIDDCADPFSVEAVRASMGALFTQDDRDRALGRVRRLAARRRRASSSAPASRRRTTISKPSIASPASC